MRWRSMKVEDRSVSIPQLLAIRWTNREKIQRVTRRIVWASGFRVDQSCTSRWIEIETTRFSHRDQAMYIGAMTNPWAVEYPLLWGGRASYYFNSGKNEVEITTKSFRALKIATKRFRALETATKRFRDLIFRNLVGEDLLFRGAYLPLWLRVLWG